MPLDVELIGVGGALLAALVVLAAIAGAACARLFLDASSESEPDRRPAKRDEAPTGENSRLS